jgi:hypothetical protein
MTGYNDPINYNFAINYNGGAVEEFTGFGYHPHTYSRRDIAPELKEELAEANEDLLDAQAELSALLDKWTRTKKNEELKKIYEAKQAETLARQQRLMRRIDDEESILCLLLATPFH